MVRTIALVVAFLIPFAVAIEAATPKTAVLVKFTLEAFVPKHFTGAQAEAVQKQAAHLLATKLQEHVPFLEFTDKAGPSFTLMATLRPRLTGERAGAPGEVILEFKLPGTPPSNREFVVFRPANDTDPIPGVEGLVKEIDLRLTEETYRVQLRSLLLQVPVAATGEVVSAPAPGWALPYNRHELCLHRNSKLGVDHVVRLPGGVLRPRLGANAEGEDIRGRIIGVPTNPQEFQQKIAGLAPGQVTVGPVFVISYEDLTECSRDFSR